MEKTEVRHYIPLLATLAAAIVCTALIFKVNVNSDMTKYLPDDSRMKQGLEIMAQEFDLSAAGLADVKVMTDSLDAEGLEAISAKLHGFEGVEGVNYLQNAGKTLFELNVAKSVDQKQLAREIKKALPSGTVTQTSQDGNTPDPMAILFAIIALVIVLIIMSSSWMDPVLFLASTGIAVALNIGTNAFLESVSITTNSLTAVLQLALSMDYSVILMNRYRQERALIQNKFIAMNSALKKARRPIISSGLTTMVGLLMLMFMNLKIGADMGFVLAKGVLCSLICAFTALPGMILFCDRAIRGSMKKTPSIPTDGIASLIEKLSIPLAVLLIAIFVVSDILHNKTQITFSTNTPSEIEQYFPKKNAVVLLYDNADEDKICALADSLAAEGAVESVISYPSLMLKKLSAQEMTAMLKELGGEQAEMLDEDIVKIAYYSANVPASEMKMSLPEMLDFVKERNAAGDPLVKDQFGDGMQERLQLLDMLLASGALQEEPAAQAAPVVRTEPVAELPEEKPAAEEPAEPLPETAASEPQSDRMKIREYMTELAQRKPSEETRKLAELVDADRINKKMGTKEMTEFMGSTPAQTKMVYSFSKSGDAMTPREFAHFLVEDLFKRKALAPMVSAEQKEGMTLRMRIMDYAAADAELSIEELDSMTAKFWVAPQTRADAGAQGFGASDDQRLELLAQMLNPRKKYSAEAMSRNLGVLGENVNAATVGLLYTWYGSRNNYNPDWKMSLEGFVNYLADNIIGNESYSAFIPDSLSAQFASMKEQMAGGVAQMKGRSHSICAIITSLPDEAPETEAFLRGLDKRCSEQLSEPYYTIGESVMFLEMKDGFGREMLVITLLTVLAILLIVALNFRSPLTGVILVMTVLSAVFINVAASDKSLYLAYLIVQSILMGATIDYGILFTTYYRENRSLKEAYNGSKKTILTSGLIMICVPGAMALFLDDAMIQPIVQSLSLGALAAVLLILFVMPGAIATLYKFKKK